MNCSLQTTYFQTLFKCIVMLFSVVCGFAQTSLASPQQRIKNGTVTFARPFTGELDTESYSCSATLIPGSSCIITAAHCSTGKSSHTFSLDGADYAVRNFVSPKSAERKRVDLAIGKLSHSPAFQAELAYDSPSQSMSIAPSDYRLSAGDTLQVVGYGEVGSQETTTLQKKREGEMAFSHYVKQSPVGKRYLSDTLVLHPGASDVSVCSGDSGGPVFHNDTLVGVTSAGWQIEAPTFLCIGERSTARSPSCNRGKGAQACTDEILDQQWTTLRAKDQQTYIKHLMHAQSIPGHLIHSHAVAQSFCRALNTPEEHLADLRNSGIPINKRYRRKFLALAASSTQWRLPTASEVRSLRFSGTRKRGGVNSLVLQTINRHNTHLLWIYDSSSSQPYRPVMHMGTGAIQYIGANATDCDRQSLGEAVSIAHYSDWIKDKMTQLGCFE